MLKGSQFARKCERKFGGSPLAGEPKLQQIEKYKFWALFSGKFLLGLVFLFLFPFVLFRFAQTIISFSVLISRVALKRLFLQTKT